MMPTRVKRKFYKMIVRLVMLYSTVLGNYERAYTHKMLAAEMHVLRWICGNTRKDKTEDDRIRGYLKITPIVNKIGERQLTWYDLIR